jgi:hypothetical protein
MTDEMRYFLHLDYGNLYRARGHLYERFRADTLEWTPDASVYTRITEDVMVDEITLDQAAAIEQRIRGEAAKM